VFSPPSLHSGGTVMLSFIRPDQAVLFAVKLQGEVAAARWTVSTGIRSRVSLHYCEGQCPAPQDDHLRLGYQEKVYQEALRINICCPPGAVLCSTAFEQAVSNGTRPLPAEVGIRFTFIDARECFRVSSDSLEAQSDDGGSDSSLSLGSFEGVMDTELGICSSNRCAWIVDNREITLGALLGQGNYGRVTKGIYKGMPVAVKRLFASRLDDAAMRKMRREAAILSGLTHPNIVQLMGLSITDGGNLLLVMELVERGSLADLLADNSAKLTWAKKLSILRDAAAGIRFLHQNGIIHRDIKSSNLLVDENWNVKVADFGFATAKQDNCTMTRCGTPAWTAPEILSGGEHMAYDDKADVYSFGIVMWEVLTRSKPYQDVNTVTVAVNVINGQRPTIPAGADKAYCALMRKCWAESPQKRPAIDDVLVYFNSALDDGQLL
jgi:tRNA A-37 threonylcarbamoyl transferase component Bud32